MYRALVIGAGRIGAGFRWHDDAYTHAGAYRALKDRVELVGFVEPEPERGHAAEKKWSVQSYEDLGIALEETRPDIVSVCVRPQDQEGVLEGLPRSLKAVWCEKPFMPAKLVWPWPIQVNYMRRGDETHRQIAHTTVETLIVYGKDDIHTRCHFEDLARWWKVKLDYRVFNGPCAYLLKDSCGWNFFDAGGVDGGECFRNMLSNLLDHVDGKVDLWSPPS